MYAGLKIFGFYLMIFGIPAFVSALVFTAVDLDMENSKLYLINNAVISGVEVFVGYVLIWHTPKLVRLGGSDV